MRTCAVGPCLPGFESIYRYVARRENEVAARLRPGEYYVTADDERVETTLGSCVAACIRDPQLQIGGMNHFLLPAASPDPSDPLGGARYGTYAMEALINEILKRGGSRQRLEVKIFGGARMLVATTDIGRQNIEFVEDYLATESIRVVSRDVGGDQARLVRYWPVTGVARLKRLGEARDVERQEQELQQKAPAKPVGGSVELF